MGNCLGRSRCGRGGEHCAKKRAVWAEEKVSAADKEEDTCKGESGPPAPATDHVKIRITRKQLEELLQRVDDGKQDGGVPAREVVSEFLCDASSSNVRRHRGVLQGQQWRPALQSIPE